MITHDGLHGYCLSLGGSLLLFLFHSYLNREVDMADGVSDWRLQVWEENLLAHQD
jgi:hypothetical protein